MVAVGCAGEPWIGSCVWYFLVREHDTVESKLDSPTYFPNTKVLTLMSTTLSNIEFQFHRSTLDDTTWVRVVTWSHTISGSLCGTR